MSPAKGLVLFLGAMVFLMAGAFYLVAAVVEGPKSEMTKGPGKACLVGIAMILIGAIFVP